MWYGLFFFFFKQKTAYEMRISDWSSDVCSSDLQVSVTLNGIGGQRMFDFTSENVGKPMAVVYVERVPDVTIGPDGKEVRTTRTSEQVISVATIQGVFGKEFQTTGLESAKEAADLALLLRAGALAAASRSEEHTSELQSLMRISYAV